MKILFPLLLIVLITNTAFAQFYFAPTLGAEYTFCTMEKNSVVDPSYSSNFFNIHIDYGAEFRYKQSHGFEYIFGVHKNSVSVKIKTIADGPDCYTKGINITNGSEPFFFLGLQKYWGKKIGAQFIAMAGVGVHYMAATNEDLNAAILLPSDVTCASGYSYIWKDRYLEKLNTWSPAFMFRVGKEMTLFRKLHFQSFISGTIGTKPFYQQVTTYEINNTITTTQYKAVLTSNATNISVNFFYPIKLSKRK